MKKTNNKEDIRKHNSDKGSSTIWQHKKLLYQQCNGSFK